MIFDIQQINKTMYTAEFVLLRKGKQIGGAKTSLSGNVRSCCLDLSGRSAFIAPGVSNFPVGTDAKYTCDVSDGEKPLGSVYMTTHRHGFLAAYGDPEMVLLGQTFRIYPMALGKEGFAKPLYADERQIAEVRHPCTVRDSLYRYTVYAEDENAAFPAVIMMMYLYTRFTFKAELARDIESTSAITFDKYYTRRYDPNYITHISE